MSRLIICPALAMWSSVCTVLPPACKEAEQTMPRTPTLGSRPLVLGAAAHSALRRPRLPMRSNEDTAGVEVSSAAPQAGWGSSKVSSLLAVLACLTSLCCQLTGRLVLRNTFIELEDLPASSLPLSSIVAA